MGARRSRTRSRSAQVAPALGSGRDAPRKNTADGRPPSKSAHLFGHTRLKGIRRLASTPTMIAPINRWPPPNVSSEIPARFASRQSAALATQLAAGGLSCTQQTGVAPPHWRVAPFGPTQEIGLPGVRPPPRAHAYRPAHATMTRTAAPNAARTPPSAEAEPA